MAGLFDKFTGIKDQYSSMSDSNTGFNVPPVNKGQTTITPQIGGSITGTNPNAVYNNQNPGWFQNPYDAPQLPQAPEYKPNYTKGTIADIIDTIGRNLSPQKAFNEQTTYDQYAQPQRAAFDIWEKQMYRPEFERQTLNPWKTNYANQAAGAGMSQLGGGKQMYQRSLYGQEQPYYNQLEQARGSWEDMMRQGYNTRMKRYYDSPTSFTNIGDSQPNTSGYYA